MRTLDLYFSIGISSLWNEAATYASRRRLVVNVDRHEDTISLANQTVHPKLQPHVAVISMDSDPKIFQLDDSQGPGK